MKLFFPSLTIILLFLACNNAPKAPVYNDPIPVHDNFKIESKHVNETRVINVWTPPGYAAGQDSFPVIYMPDGGMQEDFPHIANTIAALVESKAIPPFILVGIENTERRRDLSGPTEVEKDKEIAPVVGGSSNFRAFITDELMTEINAKYRTTQKKGIIGESLAGLFVMETFFLNPNAFDIYIAMDPSLWWNNHQLESKASEYLMAFPDRDTKLWFAGSGAEDISKHTSNLAKTIQSNAPSKLVWEYSDEPNEQHNTIFRATKEKALKWALN